MPFVVACVGFFGFCVLLAADVVWPYSEEGKLSDFGKIFEEMNIYQLIQYLKNCKLTFLYS